MRWCRRIRWFFKDKKDNVKCFIIKKKYDKVINLAVKLWRMRNIENYEESFDEVRVIWEEFFFRAFKMMGMNKKSIKVLWEDFEMSNWKAMWFEGSEFENYTYRELFETFVGEAHYICDRLTIDRIFRTHWLFKEAFYNELWIFNYGDDIIDKLIENKKERDEEILKRREDEVK